jgi:hypothetical protein
MPLPRLLVPLPLPLVPLPLPLVPLPLPLVPLPQPLLRLLLPRLPRLPMQRKMLPRSNWQHFRPMPENKKPALGLAFLFSNSGSKLAPSESLLLICHRYFVRIATQYRSQSPLCQIRTVVLFAEMRRHNVLQPLLVDPLQEIAGSLIGKMSKPPADALL